MKRAQIDDFIAASRRLMQGNRGFSPLTLAAKEGFVDIVNDLINLGADVNEADLLGYTAIVRATEENNVDMIQTLAQAGAAINATDAQTNAVLTAARCGHVDAVRALAVLGAEFRSPGCCACVYVAAEEGHVDVILSLNSGGADINAPGKNGSTPVYVAARMGHTTVIEALSELGADLNTPNDDDNTPLFISVRNCRLNSVRMLATLGADVNRPSANGMTALHLAAQTGSVDMLRTLVDFKADVDGVIKDGSTPLATAVQYGHRDAAVFLMDVGADVKQCLHNAHITDSIGQFCKCADLQNYTDDEAHANTNVADSTIASLISFTKLISSVLPGHEDTAAASSHQASEIAIATSLRRFLSTANTERLRQIPYLLKRRLLRIAYITFQASLLQDAVQLSVPAQMDRFAKLVCFFCDLHMLTEVRNLRMTCKSNNERRRFPVRCSGSYHELEGNLIEEFIAYNSSRFVSMDEIKTAMAAYYV